MVTAGTMALVEAQHIHIFPLLTAVFSLYDGVGFGSHSLFLKPLAGSARVVALDWLAAGVGLAVFPNTVACAF